MAKASKQSEDQKAPAPPTGGTPAVGSTPPAPPAGDNSGGTEGEAPPPAAPALPPPNTPPAPPARATYTVAKAFSDNPTIQPDRRIAKRYQVGEDVSGMDSARLELLVRKGYVTKS